MGTDGRTGLDPGRYGGAHADAADPAAVVRPDGVGGAPRDLPGHGWSGAVAGAARPLGTMLLRTTGRRTGRVREAIVAYVEDGPNVVTLAMNGWGAAEPAWWLNLQAHPDAWVRLPDGSREVRAREATGAERERLWAVLRSVGDGLDAHAALRPGDTAVVVLEPRPPAG